MESYTPWLLRKSERDFFKLCVEYSAEVLDHMRLLREEVGLFLGEKWPEVQSHHVVVTRKGSEIIKNRIQLNMILSEKHIDSEDRITLSNLVFDLSAVSSHIDSASHKMDIMKLKVDSCLKDKVKTMAERTEHIVVLLNEAFKLLNEDLEKVIEKTVEISRIENVIDDLRRNLIKSVIQLEGQQNFREFYTLTEMLNSLESVSDGVESVSNILGNIAISHLP